MSNIQFLGVHGPRYMQTFGCLLNRYKTFTAFINVYHTNLLSNIQTFISPKLNLYKHYRHLLLQRIVFNYLFPLVFRSCHFIHSWHCWFRRAAQLQIWLEQCKFYSISLSLPETLVSAKIPASPARVICIVNLRMGTSVLGSH